MITMPNSLGPLLPFFFVICSLLIMPCPVDGGEVADADESDESEEILAGPTTAFRTAVPNNDTQRILAQFGLRFGKNGLIARVAVDARAAGNWTQNNAILSSTLKPLEDEVLLTPINLTAQAVANTSTVVIRWSDPAGYCPIDNRTYTVLHFSKPFNFSGLPMTSNTTQCQITSGGLVAHAMYVFRVMVTRGALTSNWSDEVVTRAADMPPTSYPQGLTVLENGPTTVMVSYFFPDGPMNGLVTEHRVRFIPADEAKLGAEWAVQYAPGDYLTTHIQNLKPNTKYLFKIAARTIAGYGPESPALIFPTIYPEEATRGPEEDQALIAVAQKRHEQYQKMRKQRDEEIIRAAHTFFPTTVSSTPRARSRVVGVQDIIRHLRGEKVTTAQTNRLLSTLTTRIDELLDIGLENQAATNRVVLAVQNQTAALRAVQVGTERIYRFLRRNGGARAARWDAAVFN